MFPVPSPGAGAHIEWRLGLMPLSNKITVTIAKEGILRGLQ